MPTNSTPPIEQSATIRMGDLARDLRDEGVDVINLGSGTPDFVTPEHIIEAAKTAFDDGHTQMTTTAGLPSLREAIATKLEVDNGIEATPETISVTPGSKFALFSAINSIVAEGDEVITLDPSWVSFGAMVKLAGGDLTRVPLDPEAGFSLGSIDLGAYVDGDTQAIILNNPSNPAGAVFSRSELETIADLAIEHDCWVIADEIYEKFTYDVEHVSIGSFPGMADRTVTTNGFSKAYAMSGWRLGYVTAPKEIIESIRTIQSQTTSSAPSICQYGGVAALEGPQTHVREMGETYEYRIDAVLDIIRESGVEIPRPDGAFYVFAPVSADDDRALAETLLEKERVSVAPGAAFGIPGYIRIACTVPIDDLRTGVERIAPYLKPTV